ncbi:MAG: hypothetical protein IKX04_02040 [Clostridiales bacterium]|nr:hypothetical protein [Clostridiales bacterium]
MGKEIICKSCGASFDEDLVRCPYCGTGHLPAEENEHMQKLEDIRQDLKDYETESVKKPGRKLAKAIILILVVVALIVAIVIAGISSSGKRERDRREQKKDDFLKNQGISTQVEDSGR